MVKMLSLLLIFSSTVPSLLMKDALLTALYVALIVNYYIVPVMISHKRHLFATRPKHVPNTSQTHPKLQNHLLIDWLHLKRLYLISKSEFSQQLFFYIYIYYCYFIYFILFIYGSILVILFSQVFSIYW